MSSKIIFRSVVYSKDGITITRNVHDDDFVTFTGKNENKNAKRTYIQAPTLKGAREYILCEDWKA